MDMLASKYPLREQSSMNYGTIGKKTLFGEKTTKFGTGSVLSYFR